MTRTDTMATKNRTRKELRDLLQRQVDEIAAQWGLAQQWHITVKLADEVEGDGATARWIPGYQDATLTFKYTEFRLREYTDSDIRRYVRHELGHLLFAKMSDTMLRLLGSETMRRYQAEEERLIDVITNLVEA